MKTSCELEKKLKKLPHYITDKDGNCYNLSITKIPDMSDNARDKYRWVIRYTDYNTDNDIISVEHTSLQAAVDNTLASLKKIEYQ